MTLATYAREDGTNICPSQVRLASSLGISRPTLRKHIRKGCEMGWLGLVEQGRYSPSVYRLIIPSEDELQRRRSLQAKRDSDRPEKRDEERRRRYERLLAEAPPFE